MDLLSNSIVDVYLNQKKNSFVYGMYTSQINSTFFYFFYLIKLNSTLNRFHHFQSIIYRSPEYINMQYP